MPRSNATGVEITEREKEIEELAERIIETRVLACQSYLVDQLLKIGADGFLYDDIENLYPDPSEWDLGSCVLWIQGNCETILNGSETEDDLQDLRDMVTDNAEPQEVFEWWLVESGLADALRSIGEPILDNEYCIWWGRTCTGQSIILDGTMQKVASKWLA